MGRRWQLQLGEVGRKPVVMATGRGEAGVGMGSRGSSPCAGWGSCTAGTQDPPFRGSPRRPTCEIDSRSLLPARAARCPRDGPRTAGRGERPAGILCGRWNGVHSWNIKGIDRSLVTARRCSPGTGRGSGCINLGGTEAALTSISCSFLFVLFYSTWRTFSESRFFRWLPWVTVCEDGDLCASKTLSLPPLPPLPPPPPGPQPPGLPERRK